MENRRTLSELKAAITRSFSIGDYLEMRQRFPDEDTALWMVMASDQFSPSFGLDFACQLQSDLEHFGISIGLYLGVLDGDVDCVDKFCLKVLEALHRRGELVKQNAHAVSSRLAIGDALVDFLIGTSLEAISYYELKMPDSFQILLKYRLGLFQNVIKEDRVLHQRRVMVALLFAENPTLSVRALAKQVGLNPSTISRWMADDEFTSYIKMFRTHPQRAKPKK